MTAPSVPVKVTESPGFEHAEASEVVDVVVPRDDQIVGRGAAELAAGRHLEPLIVPVGHDRQRQVQRRKIENANILVISDHGHRTRGIRLVVGLQNFVHRRLGQVIDMIFLICHLRFHRLAAHLSETGLFPNLHPNWCCVPIIWHMEIAKSILSSDYFG